jgi:hypothetical protein
MKWTDEVRVHLTTLLIVFIVLKLTGNVPWSWVWVLAPFWIPFVFTFVPSMLVLLVLLRRVNTRTKRRKR